MRWLYRLVLCTQNVVYLICLYTHKHTTIAIHRTPAAEREQQSTTTPAKKHW